MPLTEAHIIIYSLIAISAVSFAIAGYCLIREAIEMHKYFKACNELTRRQLKRLRNGKDY